MERCKGWRMRLCLIPQPFHHFAYITADSLTPLLLHLHHSSFYDPSVASPTSRELHLRHLVSCPCIVGPIIMNLPNFLNVGVKPFKKWNSSELPEHAVCRLERKSATAAESAFNKYRWQFFFVWRHYGWAEFASSTADTRYINFSVTETTSGK